MPSVTLELISHGPRQSQILPISAHAHKYIEQFIYTENVADSSIPVAYYESDPIDSWKNVYIVDKTFVLRDNDYEFTANEASWTEVKSVAISSKYKDIALTMEDIVGKDGKIKPLFFKHKLPDNTSSAHMEILTGGNRVDVEDGYKLDIENDVIFTNFQNYFNPDTGAYRLHFVISSDEEGNSSHVLLNPVPAAAEASWEDIVLTGDMAGTLTKEYPLFTREKNSDGYTFYFNIEGTWYSKPLDNSMIRTLQPSARNPDTSWNLSFTNGEFNTVVDGSLRNYSVPEYDMQPFAPAKPYRSAPYRAMLYVNRNVLASTRKYTAINPNEGKHVAVYAYDENGILKKAYSTDGSLEGKRAFKAESSVIENVKNVFYETDKIVSFDNRNGFVLFNIELNPNESYHSSYFYESHDLEYNLVDLNPIQNKDALSHTYVFYMHPDANSNDRAIHHLKIDRSGTIVETSQNLGRNHENLQALNKDETANTSSIIGMKYNSSSSSKTFLSEYCLPYNTDYAYYVLCEVIVTEVSEEEDSFIIDVRREGGVIKEASFEDAIRANPRVLQSALGYGEEGQEVPENAVVVINAPVELLESYGGVLTKLKAEKLLKAYTNQAVHSIVDWVYDKPELTGWSKVAKEIELSMTWEGPGLDYNIYRRENDIDEWKLIKTLENPVEGSILYVDKELASAKTYYYSIRVVRDAILLPHGNSLAVMVR